MMNQTRAQTKVDKRDANVAALLVTPKVGCSASDPVEQGWVSFFDPHQTGSPERRYGDLYRMWLINPVIVQSCLTAARRKAGADDLTSIDLGLCVQGQCFAGEVSKWTRRDGLEAWHAGMLNEAGGLLSGLRVLDLGCGLGYLAPIITRLGAIYVGIDESATFMNKADLWWKAECGGRATFRQLDLGGLPSNPAKAAERLLTECGGRPDLIMAVNVLEYLQAAKRVCLLGALRHLMAPTYTKSSALFVTTNPDYYAEFSPGGFRREANDVMIACLNQKVPSARCSPLGRYKVAELLRDTGFVTMQEAFLTVPPNGDDELHRMYEDGTRAVNLGIAPFVAFASSALPIGRSLTDDELREIASASGLRYLNDKNSPSHDPDLWRAIKNEGKVVKLDRGQPLLRRHNLGGQMYIVLKGQLCAGETPESAFNPGDLFGELEANFETSDGKVRYGHYVNDVVAAADKVEVLIIPTHLASRLVSPQCSLRARLFARLREKVMLRNARLTNREWDKGATNGTVDWREFAPERAGLKTTEAARYLYPEARTNPFSTFKNFRTYILGRVAGALLELQEIEFRQFGRCAWAHCVLIDFQTLKGIAGLGDGDVNDCIRVLHHLGVLDAFAPAKDIAGQEVMHIARESFAYQGYDAYRGEDWVGKAFEQASSHHLWISKNNPNKTFERLARVCQRMAAAGKPGADSLVVMLAQLNWLLFDKTPNFFVLRDLPLLRSLAYDPLPTLKRQIFARTFSLYPNGVEWPKLEELANWTHRNHASGRSKFYAAALCEFVRADLCRYAGAFCYSTGVAANGLPVPPLPPTNLPLT